MNTKKTKVMFQNYIPNYEIKVDNEVMHRVLEYMYLGQITAIPDHEQIYQNKYKGGMK